MAKGAIKSAFKKIGGVSTVMAAYGGITEYGDSRDKGYSKTASVGRAAVDYALGEALGWKMMALPIVTSIPKAAIKGGQSLDRMSRQMEQRSAGGAFNTAYFNDTQQTYTMRQAGMELAKKSQYNLQQTMMGNEAQYLR